MRRNSYPWKPEEMEPRELALYAMPLANTTAPMRALQYFVEEFLKAEIAIKQDIYEDEYGVTIFEVTISFKKEGCGGEEIAIGRHKSRARAREIAAQRALRYLHADNTVIFKYFK